MHRHGLSEEQWRRLQKVVPRQKAGPTAILGDRLFIEAVLYRAKTGLPWRDLPERFGKWNSVFQRYNRWCKKGIWQQIFETLDIEPDLEHLLIDSTTVRAYQHAAACKKGAMIS